MFLICREAAERKRREDMKNVEHDNMKGSPQRNMTPRQYNNRGNYYTSIYILYIYCIKNFEACHLLKYNILFLCQLMS